MKGGKEKWNEMMPGKKRCGDDEKSTTNDPLILEMPCHYHHIQSSSSSLMGHEDEDVQTDGYEGERRMGQEIKDKKEYERPTHTISQAISSFSSIISVSSYQFQSMYVYVSTTTCLNLTPHGPLDSGYDDVFTVCQTL